jgi:hypothetical protein
MGFESLFPKAPTPHPAHSQALADYISSVDPAQYPAIFKTQLDVPCLSFLLRGLQHVAKVSEDCSSCWPVEACMGPVPRGAVPY